MIIVLLGPPCSGKGTQAKVLAEKHGLPCFSTGDLFRQAVAENSPLGRKVKDLLAQGHPVDDQTVNEMMTTITKEHQSFIFDGYPRNLNQAKALTSALAKQNKKVLHAINLELDDKTILSRMQVRALQGSQGTKRSDDNAEVMQVRINFHHKLHDPLVSYYKQQGILSCVNGLGTIPTVQDRIEKIFAVSPNKTAGLIMEDK